MGRGNNFDALRLVGSLAVLVAHQFYVQGNAMPYVIGFKHLGTVAVYMFFSISGYLVAKSWESDPHLFRYSARRFLRMAPGFAVLMVVSLAAQQAMGSPFFETIPHASFNASLWTLKWEVLCYAGLAGLALVMPLRIAALLAMAALLAYWRSTVFKHIPELGLMFCAGMLLYTYPVKRKWLALAIAAAAAYAMKREAFFVLMMLVPILSILIGNASWPYVRRVGRFGDFSYGIYIYAWPVQQFGVLFLGKDQPYLPMLALSLIVTGILAALSWHFVEKPALGWKRYLKRTAEVLPTSAPITSSPSSPG